MYHYLTQSMMGVAALTQYTIGGVQSGTLGLGEYTVTSDIVVLEGTTLTLTAGSIFKMHKVLWEIQGTLTAIGTAGSRITFKTASGVSFWHGIRFCKEFHTATSTMTVNTSTNAISVSFGLNADWPIRFTTTGTLPAPLVPNRRYYLLASSKLADLMSGSEIDITDSGSGTHTAYRLNPTDATLRSTDYTLTQTMQYCDILDCDKSDLPANYSLAYRHWMRGGGLFTYEVETMDFDNLRFYRCGATHRGGGAYVQGLTATAVQIVYSDWYFEDCFVETEMSGSFASSHGQAGVSITNFNFVRSDAPIYEGVSLTANAGTDVVTLGGAATPVNGCSIKNLASSGTLPAGLSGSTVYYMINSSGSTCKLSLTPGGAAVDITSAGTGSHTCDQHVDYYTFDTTLTVSGLSFS